ncbi:glyoxalase superfamily protein [Mesobacterium pallidum]|uniref:glyoxalase superfamily protein n=1 Tax=Mesobacterium pallidum TaxID=2872037 RepID=UPI001EE26858|nr:glyoxalase superfamily protein [Mesobacterium pallidum]
MTLTVDAAKAQAKALRSALAAQGTQVSHSQALELVARQQGARDWNTLAARLGQRNAPPELALGSRVRGTYLGQAFAGEIVGISGPEGARQVDIKLDAPVDTVTFDSFSNWRHRIRGTVDAQGVSPRKTSNGQPQLVMRVE